MNQTECRSKKSGVAWQEKSGAAMFQEQLSLSLANNANQDTLVKHRPIFHREVEKNGQSTTQPCVLLETWL